MPVLQYSRSVPLEQSASALLQIAALDTHRFLGLSTPSINMCIEKVNRTQSADCATASVTVIHVWELWLV
jgi:hypothetical protein